MVLISAMLHARTLRSDAHGRRGARASCAARVSVAGPRLRGPARFRRYVRTTPSLVSVCALARPSTQAKHCCLRAKRVNRQPANGIHI